jgi:hypothetical protein
MLTGDMLTDRRAPGIYAIDDKKPERSMGKFIENFTCKWNAWRFALDSVRECQKMTRRLGTLTSEGIGGCTRINGSNCSN